MPQSASTSSLPTSLQVSARVPSQSVKMYSIILLLLFVFTSIASGQSKAQTPVKAPVSNFQKLLKGTGLPVTIVNDSLAVIPYEGKHVASFQVMVQKIIDLYIIHTNLTEALPGKIDETKFKYLLQQSNYYDVIKIGLDEENAVYIRADVYTSSASTALLTRIIKQVANVTNIIGGELSAN